MNLENEMMLPLLDKRIFYIEDDTKNRAVVKTILEYSGAVVSSESWGRIEVVQNRLESFHPVDLILLDLMFPKNVSGYDVFDALRRESQFAHIPIVAISASDPAMEMPKLRAKGFNGFIAKPINIHSFPEQVGNILTQGHYWYLG